MLVLLTLLAASGGVAVAGGLDPVNVTLFFSAEVQGNFEPCGCSAGPQGGISRRVAYSRTFDSAHDHPTVQVDAGNYFQIPGPRAKVLNDFLIDSLTDVQMAVMNLGTDDLHLWDRLAQITTTAIISTNLKPADTSRTAPERFAVVPVESGGRTIRLGFLGVAWPGRVAPRIRFVGQDPVEAVAEVADQLRNEADVWVVLADFNPRNAAERRAMEQLAKTYDEIVAILYTEQRFVLPEPHLMNKAVVLAGVERGRFLGRLTLTLDDKGGVSEIEPEFVELDERVGEVPELLQRQNRLSPGN